MKGLVIMATRKPAVPAVPAAESAIYDFVSLKDAAYKQAFAGDKAESMVLATANYTRLHHPKWPIEADEVVDNMLKEGYTLRFAETDSGAPKQYGFVDGNYINVTELAVKPKQVDVISVAYATGLSNYEYRVMDNKDKKAIVKQYREAASDYVSVNKNRLIKKIEWLNTPIDEREKKGGRKRADNKTLAQHWTDTFSKGEAKERTALKNGDPDADPELYKEAVAAFWAVKNRKKK
jgi:hypothetical protein